MAMDAINSVSSITNQPIQEIKQAERVVSSSEGGAQKQQDTLAQAGKEQVSAASSINGPAAKNDLSVSTSSGQNSRQEATEEQIEADNERVKKAISEMNKKMFNNSEAVFGIHEDTNRITIKIVDKTTKETIKELPPEKTLDMIAKAWELAGLMVDERG